MMERWLKPYLQGWLTSAVYKRPDGVSSKIGCPVARTHVTRSAGQVTKRKGWWSLPTGSILGVERTWRCLHLLQIHPPETSTRQGHLYHHTYRSPQSNLPDVVKDNWYEELCPVVAEIPTSDILILLGDWNGQTWLGPKKYTGREFTGVCCVFQLKKKFVPLLRTWCRREAESKTEYQKTFIMETTSSNDCGSGTEETWEKLKSSLCKAAENVCESIKKYRWWKGTR